MKQTRDFEIAWQGLKSGVHTFRYDLDDRFFREMKVDASFRDIQAQIQVRFDKQSGFFQLHFDVGGFVTLPCDRCGDDFRMQLWDEFDLLIKLAGEDAGAIDEDADIVFISRTETVLDIRGWLYEFVLLSIPLQRIHPITGDGQSGCNPAALKLLDTLSEQQGQVKDIWKGLEALKKKTEKTKK